LLCFALSVPAILEWLRCRPLVRQPITLCVLGLLPAVALSQGAHLNMSAAYDEAYQFSKIIVYYVLLITLVTTHWRLRVFLASLVGFILVLALLALLQYHGYINIPALAAFEQGEIDPETGEQIVFLRLCSTGIYNDPNDLCLILLV